ncbi:MAG: polyprenyl synthetase family protein [Actinobacteria bacterium]|nr:polyprenyl synthetase family protein [Actinomycetota bacterium]
MTRAHHQGLQAPSAALEAELRLRLDDVEEQLQKVVRSDTAFVSEAASYLLQAGGKRFRPMLLLLAGHFGDPSDSRLVRASVAIELTHLATLYHDDVIDEADHRRGIESVNHRWDNTVAILTGDYLFARASELAAELGTEVSRMLARTIALLCDGQIREIQAAGRVDSGVEDYMEVIRRKTAALIATSCRLGAMMSDADAETTETLDGLGEALGMAFQLSDDIMDVISTEEVLGKEPGVDMKEGVYTLPVLYALADSPNSQDLRDLLSEGPPGEGDLDRALALVQSDQALAQARAAVTDQVRRAIRAAESLPQGDARDALVHLATFLAERCGAAA